MSKLGEQSQISHINCYDSSHTKSLIYKEFSLNLGKYQYSLPQLMQT